MTQYRMIPDNLFFEENRFNPSLTILRFTGDGGLAEINVTKAMLEQIHGFYENITANSDSKWRDSG